MSELPTGAMDLGLLDAAQHDLFNDWFISASHFAAGSLSSATRTFPAFRGTIS